MHVRLTRKLDSALNGLALRKFVVGDILDLPDPFVRMLVAEQWAEPTTLDRANDTDNPKPGAHREASVGSR